MSPWAKRWLSVVRFEIIGAAGFPNINDWLEYYQTIRQYPNCQEYLDTILTMSSFHNG